MDITSDLLCSYREYDDVPQHIKGSEIEISTEQSSPSMSSVRIRQLRSAVNNTVSRIHSHGKSLPASTTPDQLRAATTRGGILATEEQVDIARAQRDRNAIHYHAVAAIQIGNDAAASRTERSGSGCTALTVSSLPVLDTDNHGHRTVSSNGSKTKTPWHAMQSVTSSFRTSGTIKQEASNLEARIMYVKAKILQESHSQSGGILDSTSQVPDSKARVRVKLIIEQPERACSYIRMGLQSDPEMDSSQLIRMIDYYCND